MDVGGNVIVAGDISASGDLLVKAGKGIKFDGGTSKIIENSYILPEVMGSDHAPISLILK